MKTLLAFFVVVTSVFAIDVPHCQVLKGSSTSGKHAVTLVYTMESKCAYCYKEAHKLVILRDKLLHFGINSEIVIGIDELPVSEQLKLPHQLQLNVAEIWKESGEHNGHMFALDSCGRVAYQVILPWSKQMYPFTTMAVLSALIDKPCGECNISELVRSHQAREHETTNIHESPTLNGSLGRAASTATGWTQIPLSIIFEETHEHLEGRKNVSYDYVELKLNDAKYHGHPVVEGDENYDEDWIQHEFDYLDENPPPPIVTEWQIINGTATKAETEEPLELKYKVRSNRRKPEDRKDEIVPSRSMNLALWKHYEQLIKWKPCADVIMGKLKCCLPHQQCLLSRHSGSTVLRVNSINPGPATNATT